MKRMHIGLKVDDIDEAIAFYSRLFDAEPTLVRDDYAKWMLDDPLVNFSVDLHGEGPAGSAHYGIQVESADELTRARAHIDAVCAPHRCSSRPYRRRVCAGGCGGCMWCAVLRALRPSREAPLPMPPDPLEFEVGAGSDT